MEVGQTGQVGVPVVLHAAVDPNSVVALAPILLRKMVEHNAVGTGPSLKSAMSILAHVSNRVKYPSFLQSLCKVADYVPQNGKERIFSGLSNYIEKLCYEQNVTHHFPFLPLLR